MRRVQAFSDTGRLVSVMTAVVPEVWAALPDDRLVALRSVALGDVGNLPYVLVSQMAGAVTIDTIAMFDNPAVARFERRVGNQHVLNQQPFHQGAIANYTRDGLRFCGVSPDGQRTRLRCTDSQGRETLSRSLELRPRPLTKALYDSVVRVHLRGGSTVAELESKIDRPRSLPLVISMVMNETGEIWLQRSHRSEDSAVWARINASGTLRDEIAIPKRYRFIRPDGENFWAATADADGLETLHRCRIPAR
jgi:hypothetical protein